MSPEPSRATLSVVVQDVAGRSDTPAEDAILAWVAAVVADTRGGEITVRIVGEAESATLNERYRGGTGATNVLAFPLEADGAVVADEPLPIGDIVICADVVAREAVEQGKSAEAHWAHVVVHGALHLLGYDHTGESDAAIMEGRERELLGALGFPDPYADAD